MLSSKKVISIIFITIFFFCLTLIYLFPLIYKGLILLPLDLLISNYHPWYSPAQILLKNPYMQDSIVQLYPWKHFLLQSLQNGVLPFWNPYQHMGMPFMAAMKPMVFYPLNVIFLLGEINGWNGFLFLQILLSMLFAYWLSRDFKLGFFPSILVSLGFSLNSFMIGFLEFGSEGHVLLWLPLFLFCAKRYLEQKKSQYLFFLGLTLSFNIFAGHLQFTIYMLILLAGFIFFYGYALKTKRNAYGFLFLSILLGIGLSAIQLIPGLELFSQSYRATSSSSELFLEGLIKPHFFFRLFSPDFFGNPVSRDLEIGYIETSGYFGIIPLFFCLYAMFFARKKLLVKFFMSVFIIASLFSLEAGGQILNLLKIPVVTSGSGGRLFFLVLFSGAVLSGFGFSEFSTTKKQRKNIIFLSLFTLIFVLAVVGTALISHQSLDSTKMFLKNLRFASLILGVFLLGTGVYLFLRKKTAWSGKIFMIFIVGLTFFDLFRLGYRFLTFSNEKFLYPDMAVVKFVQEVSSSNLGRNYGLTEPELATHLNVQTIETYNPLYLLRSGQLLQALQGKPEEKLPLNKYFITSKKEKLKFTLDFLGVVYIVAEKDVNPSIEYFHTDKFQDDFNLIYQDDRHFVYENTTSYPRFNLYYQTQEAKSDEETLKFISEEAINFRKKLILNETLPFNLEEGTGSAKLLTSTINSQQFEIETDKPALFYISDTFFPGWKAEVNHQETKIYRANYNFRAVYVPAGKSIVNFFYRPSQFSFGVLISLLSLVVLITFVVWPKKFL